MIESNGNSKERLLLEDKSRKKSVITVGSPLDTSTNPKNSHLTIKRIVFKTGKKRGEPNIANSNSHTDN